MNALKPHAALLATLLTACLAGHALAQEAESDDWQKLPQAQSRTAQQAAQTEADAQAKVAATAPPATPKGKTRAEVRAELDQARRSGELARLNAEAYDFERPTAAPVVMAQRRR